MADRKILSSRGIYTIDHRYIMKGVEGFMKLQLKAAIGINVFIILACLCLGVLGYSSASDGFAQALQMQAESNVRSVLEIMEYRYPGNWQVVNGILYKGEQKMEGTNEVVDSLGSFVGGHVTVFRGDTRVATTVLDDEGRRCVGTQASEKVKTIVLQQGFDYTGSADVLGEVYESAYRPIKDASGQVIGMVFVGLSLHEMDMIQDSFLGSIIFATLFIVVLMGIVSWFIVGRTMKPLQRVAAAMHEIAEGDMRGDTLPVTPDEIGVIAESANIMRDKLRHLLTDVAASSESVTEAAHQLTERANQTTASIQQAAESAVHLAEGTTRQAATISDLQQNTATMRAHMHELHASAKAMDDVAKQSREKASGGKSAVSYAVEQIENITAQVSTSAEVVGTLGRRSSEIGMIVETISGIAEQTNLLALNAAIEAARAGEAGRGFAVVADEVRKLAEQSGLAARNITELVKAIQQDTDRAVQSIEDGNESVREGAASVEATGEAFRSIEEQVEHLIGNVQHSIQYIEALNTASHDIEDSMKLVMEYGQSSNDEAQNVSAATEQQAATMHEMADASEQLVGLARSLQEEVRRFKI